MDDRKRFGDLSHHSADCEVGWGAPHINKIQESAKHGCNRCGIHIEAILNCAPTTWIDDPDVVVECLKDSPSPSLRLKHPTGYSFIQFFTADDASHAILPLLPFHLNGICVPAKEFSLSTNLERAKGWLEVCNSDHELCRSEVSKSLPTRVLDVSTSTIRLVSGAGKTGRYACLSHCWGTNPVLETTPESIMALQQSIPWDDIPATFRDAIEFTRGLSLQYLWIDSLCIIQHDTSVPSDWQKESARMASIYENSYVTLAAATSSDSAIGCFGGTDQSFHEPYRINSTKRVGNRNCSVLARFQIPHAFKSLDSLNFPLLRRAWVFQERLLASRIIYLGCAELQWECKQTHDCECEAVGDDDVDEYGVPSRDPKRCFAEAIRPTSPVVLGYSPGPTHVAGCETCSNDGTNIAGSYGGQNICQFYTQRNDFPLSYSASSQLPKAVVWRELIRCYAKLNMTYSSDVFPALSGLAHSWHHRYGSRYIAGLWEKDFIHDLIWYADIPRNRALDWRAPTWSWASLQGLRYMHRSLAMMTHEKGFVAEDTRIKAVECTLGGPDWAGQLRHAEISITCRAIAGAVYHWPTTYSDPEDFYESERLPCRLITHDVVYRHKAIVPDRFIWKSESPAFLVSGSVVYLLPLVITAFDPSPIYTESNDSTSIDDKTVQCLMVSCCKKDSGNLPVYERIGYALLSPQSIDKETLVAVEDRVPGRDPKDWPEVEIRDEEERKRELGLVNLDPWQYDTHCKITKIIREAPLQDFTII